MAAIYSIRELEHLSGIKAHTIRIWEQRYGILQAARTDTGIRYYSESELKYLMRLALLNRNGFKISKLAKMPQEQIAEMVEDMVKAPQEYASHIEGLLLATMEYDEDRFEKIINTCILQIGFETTVIKVIFPYLEKVGMMWVSGTVIAAQEHFVSQLLRQKLIVAIDGQTTRQTPDTRTFVLFLPNGEWHELSLLFLHYLLKSHQHRVIYLGGSVPIKDVIQVGEAIQPDGFYTIITTNPIGYSIVDYLNTLATTFPKSRVFVSGGAMQTAPRGLERNVSVLHSIDQVVSRVEELTAAC